ncbi:Zn-ribbon domain-containing OB-fold protein [Solimonas soli]|uniref:Zn-ribbon domain-containing OB-fold protein n=1 Tax=Solimonas soli TaxID=413479 RepID=UPI000486078A|nr:OB-fold domain-containing protein [Solimonas soli]
MNDTVAGCNAQPFLEGWFTLDAERPQLLGNRCVACGTVYFPKLKSGYCRNPDCDGERFEETPLSRSGALWSYSNAAYQPPEPYAQVDKDAFRPFAIAAVELDKEKMIVLGAVVAGVGVEQLKVGMTMELKLGALADGKLTWMWAPAGAQA